MPHTENPDDYAWAFRVITNEVRDRPETKAFGQWLAKQTVRFETKGGSL
jgi:hypothetical protein